MVGGDITRAHGKPCENKLLPSKMMKGQIIEEYFIDILIGSNGKTFI